MLRCIKWLPYACVGAFVIFALLGWVLVKPTAAAGPNGPLQYEITFRAYDVNGTEVQATAKSANGTQMGKLPEKLTRAAGTVENIFVTPTDASKFLPRPEQVVWRKPEEYRQWLHGQFTSSIRQQNGNVDKWHDSLSTLDNSIGPVGYVYPVIVPAAK